MPFFIGFGDSAGADFAGSRILGAGMLGEWLTAAVPQSDRARAGRAPEPVAIARPSDDLEVHETEFRGNGFVLTIVDLPWSAARRHRMRRSRRRRSMQGLS